MKAISRAWIYVVILILLTALSTAAQESQSLGADISE
jgi:hypothetical protein